MLTVSLNLGVGFFEDVIIILVNGRPELRLDNFTSSASAECVLEIEVPSRRVALEIVLPKRNISRRVERRPVEGVSFTAAISCETIQFTVCDAHIAGTAVTPKRAA